MDIIQNTNIAEKQEYTPQQKSEIQQGTRYLGLATLWMKVWIWLKFSLALVSLMIIVPSIVYFIDANIDILLPPIFSIFFNVGIIVSLVFSKNRLKKAKENWQKNGHSYEISKLQEVKEYPFISKNTAANAILGRNSLVKVLYYDIVLGYLSFFIVFCFCLVIYFLVTLSEINTIIWLYQILLGQTLFFILLNPGYILSWRAYQNLYGYEYQRYITNQRLQNNLKSSSNQWITNHNPNLSIHKNTTIIPNHIAQDNEFPNQNSPRESTANPSNLPKEHSPNDIDIIKEKLLKAKEMFDNQILTQEEYDTIRKKMIDKLE